jgi:hypothetical protein
VIAYVVGEKYEYVLSVYFIKVRLKHESVFSPETIPFTAVSLKLVSLYVILMIKSTVPSTNATVPLKGLDVLVPSLPVNV